MFPNHRSILVLKKTHTHKGWKVSKCHKRWPRRYTTVGGGELNFF